jgi:hypothetical protein
MANRYSSSLRVYDCGRVNYSVSYNGAAWDRSTMANCERKTKALALSSLGLEENRVYTR